MLVQAKSRAFWGFVFVGLIAGGRNLNSQDPAARDLTLEKTLPGRSQTARDVPRGYALVIGVSKYEKLPTKSLRYPESDAAAIYRVLISQEGGAFASENVHQLFGAKATLANIKHELEVWLPAVAQPADRVVVYFAGHGFVVGSRGFLAPYDVDLQHIGDTAYPMDQLGKTLADRVKARWKALFVDACHSGKINPDSTDEAIDDQLAHLPKTFLTFTATRNNEQSFEDPSLSTGFGVFTYFLVQGLQGNADNDPCDGIVTANELVEYVRAAVKKYTREHGGLSQTPQERGDYESDMILAVRHACAGGAPPPESLSFGALIVETLSDDVEVYVDDKLIGMASKDKPLPIPGLSTGIHKVMGVRKGYQPALEEVMVVPGQERSVTLRVQYRREYKKSSLDLVEKGEARLFKKVSGGSSFNPLSVYRASGQTAKDLEEAKTFFNQALKEDPSYERAAFDLAMTCQLLSDHECALKSFREAVHIEPTDAGARIQLGGALIEDGDADEAVRQLTEAIVLEPGNALAHSHLARAYLDKNVWDRAVEEADASITRDPAGDQAYLWKADALRHRAAVERNRDRKISLYQEAAENFRTFIRLTNFSSPVYEQFAYYAVGFGLGSRKHADRKASYNAERSTAYMGLCNCEHLLGNLLQARDYCRRALNYDPNEPLAYFFLGDVYVSQFNALLISDQCPAASASQCREYLLSARANYKKVVEINPDLEQARLSRGYIESIEGTLPLVGPKSGH